MAAKVDLYDNAYAHYDAEVYRQIRVETYGEDLGQTSWVNNGRVRRNTADVRSHAHFLRARNRLRLRTICFAGCCNGGLSHSGS